MNLKQRLPLYGGSVLLMASACFLGWIVPLNRAPWYVWVGFAGCAVGATVCLAIASVLRELETAKTLRRHRGG